MNFRFLKNPLVSLPLLIIIILSFSYKDSDIQNKDLKTELIVLQNAPEYIINYKKLNYYKITSQKDSVFRLTTNLIKPIKNDSLLWHEFKNLKKGDKITITYYNAARKNVKKSNLSIVQIKYKDHTLVNIKEVQRIDRNTHFIIIGFMSLIVLIGLYQEFKDYLILKSID